MESFAKFKHCAKRKLIKVIFSLQKSITANGWVVLLEVIDDSWLLFLSRKRGAKGLVCAPISYTSLARIMASLRHYPSRSASVNDF